MLKNILDCMSELLLISIVTCALIVCMSWIFSDKNVTSYYMAEETVTGNLESSYKVYPRICSNMNWVEDNCFTTNLSFEEAANLIKKFNEDLK